MKQVTLREVTLENWLECIRLEVDKIQSDYIPSNAISLAESKFRPDCVLQAIYAGPEMVGFLMYEIQNDCCELMRFMLDYHHQRKEYGKKALRIFILKIMKEHPDCQKMMASFMQENVGATRLFKSLAFQIQHLEKDEILASFSLKTVEFP